MLRGCWNCQSVSLVASRLVNSTSHHYPIASPPSRIVLLSSQAGNPLPTFSLSKDLDSLLPFLARPCLVPCPNRLPLAFLAPPFRLNPPHPRSRLPFPYESRPHHIRDRGRPSPSPPLRCGHAIHDDLFAKAQIHTTTLTVPFAYIKKLYSRKSLYKRLCKKSDLRKRRGRCASSGRRSPERSDQGG